MYQEHIYPNHNKLFSALHTYCVDALQTDLKAAAKVSCYLSGGSTPLPLYTLLAQSQLPWHRIYPALVDERWVAIDSPASNEGMLRRAFRQQSGFLELLTGMKDEHATALQAAKACTARYTSLPLPISFCLLGMGNDGHTASLFPHALGLDTALSTPQKCVALTAVPSAVTGILTERMSLSLAGIVQSKRIVLVLTGKEKREVLQRAMLCKNAAEMPVSAVLNQSETPVDIFYSP